MIINLYIRNKKGKKLINKLFKQISKINEMN